MVSASVLMCAESVMSVWVSMLDARERMALVRAESTAAERGMLILGHYLRKLQAA